MNLVIFFFQFQLSQYYYYCAIFHSVEIYGRMSTDLLPTPAKSHYLFNLRDLSKCIQGKKKLFPVINFSVYYNLQCWFLPGVLQADAGVIREHNQIFRLFCHECQRVFHDRLINKTDKKYFYGILSEMASKHFSKVCWYHLGRGTCIMGETWW